MPIIEYQTFAGNGLGNEVHEINWGIESLFVVK